MKKRRKHIFSDMGVGDLRILKENIQQEQAYCHVYARHAGKKFTTRTVGATLVVSRTK